MIDVENSIAVGCGPRIAALKLRVASALPSPHCGVLTHVSGVLLAGRNKSKLRDQTSYRPNARWNIKNRGEFRLQKSG